MSFGDWSHDSGTNALSDTVLIGDLALRYGIADHAEIRFGWTPYGHVRTRDRATGRVTTASGTGDMMLGIKRNLVNPDGKNFSIALLPSVTIATGGQAIGAGDWGAAIQVPISVPVNTHVSLVFTPDMEAAVNDSGNGRHIAWGTAGGIAIAPVDGLNIALEADIMRNDDPADASTQTIAGAALGWMISRNTQFDVGSEFGLSHATPDMHLYFGIARRF